MKSPGSVYEQIAQSQATQAVKGSVAEKGDVSSKRTDCSYLGRHPPRDLDQFIPSILNIDLVKVEQKILLLMTAKVDQEFP